MLILVPVPPSTSLHSLALSLALLHGGLEPVVVVTSGLLERESYKGFVFLPARLDGSGADAAQEDQEDGGKM